AKREGNLGYYTCRTFHKGVTVAFFQQLLVVAANSVDLGHIRSNVEFHCIGADRILTWRRTFPIGIVIMNVAGGVIDVSDGTVPTTGCTVESRKAFSAAVQIAHLPMPRFVVFIEKPCGKCRGESHADVVNLVRLGVPVSRSVMLGVILVVFA